MFAQILAGLVAGGVYAALAVCLVLMYQMLGVLSFAQSALGALGACSMLGFQALGLPAILSVLAGVAVGAVIGVVCGWLMARYFTESSVETRSAATVGFLVVAVAIGNRILNGATYSFPDPFGGRSLFIGDQGVPVGTIVEVALVFLLAIGVTAALQKTFLGAQLRAMSERATTAQLLGVKVNRLTVLVWAFACAVSTLAVVFVLPTSTTSFPPLAYLIIPATAAALLGLLQNMYLAALGGLFMGIAESLTLASPLGRYTGAIPFLIVVVVMTYWRRKDVWSEAR